MKKLTGAGMYVCIYSSHGHSGPHMFQAVLEYISETKEKKKKPCMGKAHILIVRD